MRRPSVIWLLIVILWLLALAGLAGLAYPMPAAAWYDGREIVSCPLPLPPQLMEPCILAGAAADGLL